MIFLFIYIISGILLGFLFLRILGIFKRSDLYLPDYTPVGKLKWNNQKQNLLYINGKKVGNFEENAVYQVDDNNQQVLRGTLAQEGIINNSFGESVAFCSPNGKRWWGLKSALIAGIFVIIVGVIVFVYNQIFNQGQFSQNTGLFIISTGIILLIVGLLRSYFTWWAEVYAINTDGKICNGKDAKEIIIGYANELRFSSPQPNQLNQYMKGGACLSLYKAFTKPYSEEEETGVISTLSAKDLAFPAMLVSLFAFILITTIFNLTHYNLIKHIGDFSYIFTLFLVYGLIWYWLYNYKCENANYNSNLDSWIEVINRNTGLFSLNLLLILVSGVLVVLPFFPNTNVGGFIYFPYYAVILFATVYNLKVDEGKRWKVIEPFEGVIQNNQGPNNLAGAQRVPVAQIINQLGEKKIEWDLSKLDINDKKLKTKNNSSSVQLSFQYDKSQIDNNGGKLREENPFYGDKWKEAWKMDNGVLIGIDHDKFSEKINEVLKKHPISEAEWLDIIVNQCKDIMELNNLPDYEIFDLIINFCQTQIKYFRDEECVEIKNAGEYVRFGVESIFDQKGDCDCKAALAYKLIKRLNIPSEDVKYAYIHPDKNFQIINEKNEYFKEVNGQITWIIESDKADYFTKTEAEEKMKNCTPVEAKLKGSTLKHAFILLKEKGKFKFPHGKGTVINNTSLSGSYVFCECTDLGWRIGDHNRYDLSNLKIVNL
jgi:hypothetical protein